MSFSIPTFPIPTPDLTFETAWWDEPTPPTGRLAETALAGCMGQIAEAEGKQSCYLTSQLNAWMLRGALSTDEAAHIQRTVSTEAAYEKYWSSQKAFGTPTFAWSRRPAETAFAIRALIGRRMAFRIGTIIDLEAALGDGYATVMIDTKHTRVAYQHNDTEVSVFDPKYSEYTGVYPVQEAIERFHLPQRQVTII